MDYNKQAGLKDLVVLVTRPAGQAGPLCQLLESAGATAVQFPTIAVEAPEDAAEARACLANIDQYQLVIFVSANAVKWAFKLGLQETGIPETVKIATVGAKTAAVLQAQGYRTDICPQGVANTESLTALDSLKDVSKQYVLIIRGQGGREKLADILRARGGKIDYCEVYRRRRPDVDLCQWIQRSQARVDVAVATSNEGLRNLFDMAGESCQAAVLSWQLIVFSERAVVLARELGFKRPAVVAQATNDVGLVDAIREWRGRSVDLEG